VTPELSLLLVPPLYDVDSMGATPWWQPRSSLAGSVIDINQAGAPVVCGCEQA
jgi:hypothetical protein